ncbi:MAG: DUF3090 family protein [Candidatus Dormibacteria bacterium]
MAILEVDFESADAITVGVEGAPGARTFFLEAFQGSRSCTLLLEKIQLQELGTQLLELLEPPSAAAGAAAPAPRLGPDGEPGWRVGEIKLSLDEPSDRCTLVLEERQVLMISEEEAEAGEAVLPEDPNLRQARIVATLSQVRQLAARALEVVQGGRPICPLCRLPIDPGGHVCPASNGHQRV